MFGGMELQHRLTPVNYKDTSSMLGRSSLAPSPDYLSTRRLEHMWEVLAGIYGYTERTWGADGISHLAIV